MRLVWLNGNLLYRKGFYLVKKMHQPSGSFIRLSAALQITSGSRDNGADWEWIAGALFIKASQQWLEQFEDVKFEGLQGAGARKTLLVVGIMAAHGLGEGCGVGVSFCGARGWAQASPTSPFCC